MAGLADLFALIFAQNGGQVPPGTVDPNSPFAGALAQQEPAPPPPPPEKMVQTPETAQSPNQGQPTDLSQQDTLAALMGSVQAGQPHRVPVPMSPQTEIPRALNPQITQTLMTALMGANNPGQQRTLGQIFGGQ